MFFFWSPERPVIVLSRGNEQVAALPEKEERERETPDEQERKEFGGLLKDEHYKNYEKKVKLNEKLERDRQTRGGLRRHRTRAVRRLP